MDNTEIQALRRLIEPRSPQVFFDVGANIGYVSKALLENFHSAALHAFEPSPVAFDELKRGLKSYPNATLNQMALSIRPSLGYISKDNSPHNTLSLNPNEAKSVQVEISTGDLYCSRNNIDIIDFLKIDTEGFDLDVLAGFSDLLSRRAISVIQLETTTNLDNRFHVHLERFIHWLHPFGYRLHSLFEYHRHIYMTGQKMNGAWFCNSFFVAEVKDAALRRDGRN
ncbi:FkbM family methyltransferase [Pseudorhodobacter sp. E13]|uniref:FkbM family methyltransferase n=1 Tax=Pseudorhodobacter sp. E13 TaxID=2487931 RepID=UPI000F8C51EF|nr:FkbM family methyltransferase [Pseudorhodobacter sp. E13]RUS65192.1 FkbM family methyltransferase [Pseudorhodobacter sp. E13]